MSEEHQPRREEDAKEFAEEQASLFKITFGPLIWAVHFVVCYGLVAVTCAKGWELAPVRDGLLVFSAVALAAVCWTGWGSWRQWRPDETGDFVNHGGRAEDRHHFLGHAAFLLAIIAALATALVIYLLAYRDGVQGTRLILIGIGIAAMLDSLVAYVIVRAAAWDLQVAMRWLTGSLNGATWGIVLPLVLAALVLIPVLLTQARQLELLQLGDDAASALGARVERTRLGDRRDGLGRGGPGERRRKR